MTSYRTDQEWLTKVALWHKQHGIPLPPTFPNNDKMRDAAQNLFCALTDALPILEKELHKSRGSYGSHFSKDRDARLEDLVRQAKAALADCL